MGTLSVNKLAGLALIFGPLISFIFFLIEPGGLLIENAKVTDVAGAIVARGNNGALTNITNMATMLGLVIMLFGMYVLLSRVSLSGNGKALTQLGFFLILVGIISWVFAAGTDLILADADTRERAAGSVPVYFVGAALTYVGGLFMGLGTVFFALGLSTRADFNRIISLLAALVSALIFIFVVIGILDNGSTDNMFTIARILYVGWVLWLVYLGVGILNKPDPEGSS